MKNENHPVNNYPISRFGRRVQGCAIASISASTSTIPSIDLQVIYRQSTERPSAVRGCRYNNSFGCRLMLSEERNRNGFGVVVGIYCLPRWVVAALPSPSPRHVTSRHVLQETLLLCFLPYHKVDSSTTGIYIYTVYIYCSSRKHLN